jgi:hypothetical protein
MWVETYPFSPWQDASNGVAGADLSALCYVKCIADLGAAGTGVDQATVQVATAVDTITFRYAEGGGALAVDTDIDSYTGATGAGAAGTITTVDANANTVGEIINIINGVGLGQTATRRWRAALADVPPALATVASDLLVMAQTNVLLGNSHPGLRLLIDTSNAGLMQANDIWVGIGTSGGTVPGTGAIIPDYFEDIPGSSTTASVNTPVRSSSINPRLTEQAVTRRYQYRITGFAIQAINATTPFFCVHDINNNVIWGPEPLTAAAVTTFQDRSRTPIVGPVGSPLFFRFGGAGALTDGSVLVQAERRAV